MGGDLWHLVWPDVEGVAVDQALVVGDHVRLDARCVAGEAACPGCRGISARVHSRYLRRLVDRPLGGRRLAVHVQARRFFCINASCEKGTFDEQVPNLTSRHSRCSPAAARMVQTVGLALGGRPGSRLLQHLGIPVGRATVLSRVKALPLPAIPQVRVLGVDEFAIQRALEAFGTGSGSFIFSALMLNRARGSGKRAKST